MKVKWRESSQKKFPNCILCLNFTLPHPSHDYLGQSWQISTLPSEFKDYICDKMMKKIWNYEVYIKTSHRLRFVSTDLNFFNHLTIKRFTGKVHPQCSWVESVNCSALLRFQSLDSYGDVVFTALQHLLLLSVCRH